jgi:ribulose-phosphate 3-epimerase
MSQKQSVIRVSPSLLAADFSRIAEEVKRAEESGAEAIHLDVMDGHFVPNLTMGPALVAAVNRVTDLYLDVHLMIYNPFDFIEPFVEAGANGITFHFEAVENVEEVIDYIHRCNVDAGLAFSPETSADFIPRYLPMCERILIMTVQPGFGGQTFQHEMLDKIRFAREIIDEQKLRFGGAMAAEDPSLPEYEIQVDGGIDQETAAQCVKAGANSIVAGTYLYRAGDMKERISQLHLLGAGRK